MRSKFNTAWFLVVVLAVASIVVVVQAYQTAHAPPPAPPITSPVDPKTRRVQQAVAPWKAKLSAQNLSLTWPYLGSDYAARIDLPHQQPITLNAWDADSESKTAAEAYTGFVQARTQARVPNPAACIVHVFDSTGVEVAQASVSGVQNAANAPLEPQ